MDKAIIIVKHDSTCEQIDAALQKIKPHKQFNSQKYIGRVKGVYGDALDYQKQLRDEWA
jgi:hypothetical protein